MAKINLNGIIQKVGTPVEINDNGFMKQEIFLMVPGYVDGFGEKVGKDEHWCITILGDSIDKFNLNQSHEGEKAKTECYVNSRQFVNKSNEVFFNINVNLAKIDFVRPQNQQAVPPQTEHSGDLPF